ncbi:hypothetical protein GCM10015535_41530 [Streptomyces gelaticus]|uniref:Trypsin-co-occurring domain-containing protein n=1 Tax=Streptomyces gelaticus TaxID=285446 RepID=A0ABQ2W4S9_9ACTN|nr:trypco2 family protein [Streptomyces gelaticus]GGV89023.1 hypothetical protein GCM10015535_41530 [Streptomyces gelaticus]
MLGYELYGLIARQIAIIRWVCRWQLNTLVLPPTRCRYVAVLSRIGASGARVVTGAGMSTIGLAAAIEELREELYQAQVQSAGQQFAFQVEEVHLELLLELRDGLKGDGKLNFGVATIGASGEHSTARTHKLTLKLQVKDRAAGGSNPEISQDVSGSWADED